MKNINFDNPYLLLVLIPLLVAILVPFFIAIRKENKSKSVIASLCIHLVMAICVSLAIAGITYKATVTRTEVYVVADASYSTNEKLDLVDEYIRKVQSSLPSNTQMGVVAFGKDYVLHNGLRDSLTSIRDAQIDNSATNIYSAVDYASGLFSDNVVKRIVLITDGADTDEKGIDNMIATVERLHAEGIQIDAMYIDSNLSQSTSEAQISGVTFNKKTYLNHKAEASVLVQSSADMKGAFLTLTQSGTQITRKPIALSKGFNVFNFEMPTDKAGEFDYSLSLTLQSDATEENNHYAFTQSVSDELNVLFISQSKKDLDGAIALYGENSKIYAYMDVSRVELKEIRKYENITVLEKLPMTIEELCKYDEIILSDMDVREIENVSYFIDLVGKVVSEFGKSLVTIGDMQIQNKTDESLKKLEEMLPVRFGNDDEQPKLYGIVIDSSRSMYTASRLEVAKKAACYLVNMLNEGDWVAVIQFSGESFVVQDPIEIDNKQEIIDEINTKVVPMQGTYIGGALDKIYNEFFRSDVATEYSSKQLMLISDGLTFTAETKDAGDMAELMFNDGIVTSVLNPYSSEIDGINLLKEVASKGGGKYYEISGEAELEKVMFSDIAGDVTESVVEKELQVSINRKDDVLDGIESVPNIYGFIQSTAKPSSSVVLTVSPKNPDIKVPLYAYRDYGNGTVSSLTTSLSGDWVKDWASDSGKLLMNNIFNTNVPEEKIDYPYRLEIEDLGGHINVQITPLVINPNATVTATLTLPNGEITENKLVFDSEKYFYSFKAEDTGKYKLSIKYSYLDYNLTDEDNKEAFVTYESVNCFNRSYSKEYDRFEIFSPASLNSTIRHRGTVTEDGTINLEPREEDVVVYTLDLVPILTALAVILFVVDIIVRKIKLADITGLFKGKSKEVKK